MSLSEKHSVFNVLKELSFGSYMTKLKGRKGKKDIRTTAQREVETTDKRTNALREVETPGQRDKGTKRQNKH